MAEPLHTLFSYTEQEKLSSEVLENETPLGLHWKNFAQRWKALGRSVHTLRSVRSAIRNLMRSSNLRSIEQANTPCYMSDLLLEIQHRKNLTACTRNTYLKNLNTYMIWLEKRGIIDENRLRKAEKSTEPQIEQPCQTKEEIQQVIEHTQTRDYFHILGRDRDILFLRLLCFTGARRCELLDMHMNDIYINDGMWTIRIYGRKRKGRIRYYSCPNYILEIYHRYKKERMLTGITISALFISLRTGKPWTLDAVNLFYRRVSRETGIAFSGHRVRRYVATKLHYSGLSLYEIGEYLGHTREQTTRLYIRRTKALTQKASRLMSGDLNCD